MASTLPRRSSSAIVISAKPKKRIPVNLLGVEYMVKQPKMSLLLAITAHSADQDSEPGAVNRDFQTILKLMFTEKDLVSVNERLQSADDDLDLDYIFEAITAISEDESDRPSS